MRSAAVLLQALILLVPCAQADDTGWPSFASICHAELIPEWEKNAKEGLAWDMDSEKNLRELADLADRVCPEYFKHPNDAPGIRAFSEAKTRVLDHSPQVEKKAQELIRFLEAGLDDYQRTFAPADVNFATTACGTHVISTRHRTQLRLEELRRRVTKISRECFERAGTEA